MPDDGTLKKRKERTNLDFYHSPTQLRFDTWHRLEEHTSRLREKHMRKADIASLSKRIRDELTMLETIENYSAFPSTDDIKLLWQLYDQQDFAVLSRVVARIVRALTNGTYRSREINLRMSSELDERDELSPNYEDERHQRP